MLEGLDGGALGRKMGGICGMLEGARNWDVFGGRLKVMMAGTGCERREVARNVGGVGVWLTGGWVLLVGGWRGQEDGGPLAGRWMTVSREKAGVLG